MDNCENEYDERTPDSGCYSIVGGLNTSTSIADFGIDSNGLSYIKYINTFAEQERRQHHSNHQFDSCLSPGNNFDVSNVSAGSTSSTSSSSSANGDLPMIMITSREELVRLDVFELNEIIDQIESTTKELSEALVVELAHRDELEFEKETRNTFISLLMSIQVRI